MATEACGNRWRLTEQIGKWVLEGSEMEYLNADVGNEKTFAGFKGRLARARRRNRILLERRAELVKQLTLVDRDLDHQQALVKRLEKGAV